MTFIENDILNINCLRQYDIKIRIFLLPMYVFTAWRGGGTIYPLPIPRPPEKLHHLLRATYSVTKDRFLACHFLGKNCISFHLTVPSFSCTIEMHLNMIQTIILHFSSFALLRKNPQIRPHLKYVCRYDCS